MLWSNTFVNHFIANDSLLVVNLSSGHIDNHLYIYNLNTKALTDSIEFPINEELRNFIILNSYLYILLNDYQRNISKIVEYNLQLKKKTDHTFVFYRKNNDYTYVNKIMGVDKRSSTIYFLLTNGVKPDAIFPLIGKFNLHTHKVAYVKCWYPFLKDKKNKNYYFNDAFSLNDRLLIAYKTTSFCNEYDLTTKQVKLVKTNSVFLDSLFNNHSDSLEDIYASNYFYYDVNQKVVIQNKDYILRHISLDESQYGSGLELVSIIDTNLDCVGEQIMYYFKNREKFLSINFSQKYNDSLNISCYVYNNRLVVKKGTYKIKQIKKEDYFNQLNLLKKEIEKDLKETCSINIQTIETENTTNKMCDFINFLKKKKKT